MILIPLMLLALGALAILIIARVDDEQGDRDGKGDQDFHVDFASIAPMLEACGKLLQGTLSREELDKVLELDAYSFEFSRYGDRITKEEFTRYFLSLPHLREDEVVNMGLKMHHDCYLHLFAHLDLYADKARELGRLLTDDIFKQQIQIAKQGLPDDLELPSLKFVFGIGVGPSFGYVHGNGMHFDLLSMVINKKSPQELLSTLAHEVHHVGIGLIGSGLDIEHMSLEQKFYLTFAGEGLAVKYCNNAEGVLSRAIHPGPKNIGLDAFSWDYLNADFEPTMQRFRDTVRQISDGTISSEEVLDKQLEDYWFNPRTAEHAPDEVPKLLQMRIYSLGNEIWGLIHDCFGKDVVFDTFRHPEKFPEVFNHALKLIGRPELSI